MIYYKDINISLLTIKNMFHFYFGFQLEYELLFIDSGYFSSSVRYLHNL